MVSEARKRANAKWNAENMKSVSTTISKDKAEAFKAFCESHGKTMHTVLREFIEECIEGRE